MDNRKHGVTKAHIAKFLTGELKTLIAFIKKGEESYVP
jgi:hypothetical protein